MIDDYKTVYQINGIDDELMFSYTKQIIACGLNQCANLTTYLYLKIVLVREGIGHWIIGEHDYTVKAGDILILDPSKARYLHYVEPPVPFCMDYITFPPSATYPNIDCLNIFLHRPSAVSCVLSQNDENYKEVRELFEKIYNESKKNDDGLKNDAIHAGLLSLLVALSRAYRLRYKNISDKDNVILSRQSFDRINQVVKYINDNYTENITEKTVARAINMSTGHLSRLLHKFWDIGFSEYLRRVRVRQVIILLYAEPYRPVLDIAFSCGFGSSSGFYKTMKELTNLTPKELIKRSPIPRENI